MESNRKNLSLNLGSLQATTTIELHTHHAARHFFNRPTEDRRGYTVGLTTFMQRMSLIHEASANDDPYADWIMLIVENKLVEARKRMETMRGELGNIVKQLPERFSISTTHSTKPLQLSVSANSPLAYQCAYLVCELDEYVAHVMQLRHIGMLPTIQSQDMIFAAGHLFRSLTALVQNYRNAGVTRNDMAANNPKARAAIERLGIPPQDILEGTRRSQFAPPVNRNRQRSDGTTAPTQATGQSDATETSHLPASEEADHE